MYKSFADICFYFSLEWDWWVGVCLIIITIIFPKWLYHFILLSAYMRVPVIPHSCQYLVLCLLNFALCSRCVEESCWGLICISLMILNTFSCVYWTSVKTLSPFKQFVLLLSYEFFIYAKCILCQTYNLSLSFSHTHTYKESRRREYWENNVFNSAI